MKKLCTAAGCNAIVDHNGDGSSPRCTKHPSNFAPRKKYEHHYDDRGRNIYDTPLWKKYRKAQLLLKPLCEDCLMFGISTPAKIVDHVIEIKDGGEIYDFDNFRSLCPMHHNKKTGQEKSKRNKKPNKYPSLSDF